MKRRRKKEGAKLIDSKLQVALIIVLLLFLVIFCGAVALSVFADLPETAQKWLALLTGSVDALSVFLIPVLSIWVTRNVIRSKDRMEEELKIEPDHHKIICQYKSHSREFIDHKELADNMCNKDGVIMSLCNVADDNAYNPETDMHSEAYFERQRDVNYYRNGRLLLPAVSVFTNVRGVTVTFADSTTKYALPTFLQENAAKLISAHRASNVSNGATIRLNDFDYDNGALTLKTQRSDYMDMLMTNRCMDFDLDGMSVRTMFEHTSAVTPLKDSKLCNQIGINGLVCTNDGYLLVEKRGRKKAVWKNKYAQPISLALKLNDVKTNKDGVIGSSAADAEACFKNVIAKTLRGNFGLILDTPDEKGDYKFGLSQNFMGIARDLLEGGKPNLYFYVAIDMSARELKAYLERNSMLAVRVSEARNKLGRGVTQTANNPAHETTLSQIDVAYKADLQQLIREGYIAITEKDGNIKLALGSVNNTVALSNPDTELTLLDKMSQSKADKDLGEILSKKLPKVNKNKLDSQFYLVQRNSFVLDYDYAAKIPANQMLGVQRMFYPCVSKTKERREARRVAQYNLQKDAPCRKYLDRECGEALLSSLYYAAVLDLENRIKTRLSKEQLHDDKKA